MSDTPAPVKVKLSQLLDKVTQIASGADKAGVLPDDESYDASTAPSSSMRWCASILRVLLLRVIEHVKDTRSVVNMIMNVLKDPALKEGENWRSDLPAMREQMREIYPLVMEIATALRAAAQGQEQPKASAQEGVNAADNNGHTPSAEEIEALAQQAQVDEMATAIAQGQKPDLESLTAPPPPTVVPIQKKNRNPAGNEKA